MPLNQMVAYGTGRQQYRQYQQEMVDLSRKPDNYDNWKQKRIAQRQAYIAKKKSEVAKKEEEK